MKFKTWAAWFTKELDLLEEMRLAGKSFAEIAAALPRHTEAAVRVRCMTEHVRKPSALEKWLYLLRRPHTIAGLAGQLGVTKNAVKQAKRKLRRLGFDVVAATWKGPNRVA